MLMPQGLEANHHFSDILMISDIAACSFVGIAHKTQPLAQQKFEVVICIA